MTYKEQIDRAMLFLNPKAALAREYFTTVIPGHGEMYKRHFNPQFCLDDMKLLEDKIEAVDLWMEYTQQFNTAGYSWKVNPYPTFALFLFASPFARWKAFNKLLDSKGL